jgi:hypothetical protein
VGRCAQGALWGGRVEAATVSQSAITGWGPVAKQQPIMSS